MDRTLIANTTIFDGSGAKPFAGDVLIEGRRIAAVQRGAACPAMTRASSTARGATLMPGLIEPHGHVELSRRRPHADSPAPARGARPRHRAQRQVMLDCGYTSVLSAASAKPRLDIVIRNEINAGRIPGPRYLANGPEITVTGGLGDENLLHLPHNETPTFAWVADGPDEIRKVAACSCARASTSSSSTSPATTGRATAAPSRRHDRRRGGGGHGDRRGPRRARVRPRPQRRVGEDVRPARHRHHLSRQFRRRRGARPARGQRDRVFVGPALGLTYQACTRPATGASRRVARAWAPARARGRRRDDGADAQARHPGAPRRRLRLRLEPARHLRARPPAVRRRPRLHADGDAGGRHPDGRRDHGHGRTSWARSSRATSPICCSSTATRSPTSSGCRTRTRCCDHEGRAAAQGPPAAA